MIMRMKEINKMHKQMGGYSGYTTIKIIQVSGMLCLNDLRYISNGTQKHVKLFLKRPRDS